VTVRREILPLLALALAVRLVPVLTADRITADVERYQKVAVHVLDRGLNPYVVPNLYPYPPVWVWWEAASEWLARRGAGGFAVLVKLPIVAADLLIVALLFGWSGRGRAARAAPWLYALHPVSVLVTGFHGQFDAIALALLLLAIDAAERGHHDRSALALAGAIAVKSFPVLLVPFFLKQRPSLRARARYLALATVPVALLILPYAAVDAGAVRRELFGYSGVADFGWIGLVRGTRYLWTGVLARSEPWHWSRAFSVAKPAFLAGYAVLVAAFWIGRLRAALDRAALAVFLAFVVLYGAVSAQYLLWAVPFGLVRPDRWAAAYAATATVALVGFYPFLAPGVLSSAGGGPAPAWAAAAWVLGVASVLAVSAAWLGALCLQSMDRNR
jgi:hypothetical protein